MLLIVLFVQSVLATNLTDPGSTEPYLHLASGNSLWLSLLTNCNKNPSMACVENSMYTFMRETVDQKNDIQVTPFLRFTKNHMEYHEELKATEPDEVPESTFEAMSRSLYGRSVNFLMNHDMQVQLPDGFFEGSTLKISPRGFEGNGALVRIDVVPKQVAEARIFKKIKKFINEKLIYALMAILLVIKLLAAKFLFFMPMVVGAVTAKKLLIKVLLFLFPALHHFFKLCAYAPHGTKFHHHKHHINHIHHISHPHKPHHHGHHHHDDGVEIIRPHDAGPPHGHGTSLHHSIDLEEPHKPFYNPDEQELEYYSGGPALSHSFINNRQDSSEESNEVLKKNRPLKPTEIEAMVLKAEREAMLKARLQQERKKIQEENLRLHEQVRQAIRLQEKLKQQAVAVKGKLPVPPKTFLQTPEVEKKDVYAVPHESPYEKALHQAASITFDPFYSPILEKIDKVLMGLGVKDEGCRERLICSMYKNPVKFSPHSNLLSAELSRDSSELQKPKSTNAAVIRFYRYVQSARDGQDKRDCLRLYPACSINTE